jgi:hypothetical protein
LRDVLSPVASASSCVFSIVAGQGAVFGIIYSPATDKTLCKVSQNGGKVFQPVS